MFSPVWGAKRQAARSALAISGAYSGARYDRKQTMLWQTSRGSADADTLSDLPELRARSRDLVRNNMLAGGAINTVVLNVVGTGLTLQPTPDAEVLGWDEDQARTWSQQVSHEFALWAESADCDITRTLSFYDSQGLMFRSWLESGDAFTLLTQRPVASSVYKTRFQLIEADRVRTPGAEGVEAVIDPASQEKVKTGNHIYGGVEQDEFGAPVAYCILDRHPGAVDWKPANWNAYKRVLAFGGNTGRRLVLHHFDRLRPDQNRGVPYLAPVIEGFKMLDKYSEAEMMKAVVQAAFTVFVKTELGEANFGEPTAAVPPSDGDITLGNGKVVGLQPGQDVAFPATTSPNSAYDPFVTSILRQIGMNLGLPYEVLIKHFTASYSAARAALLEAWKLYKNRRAQLASGFCQPVFEAWMDEAVAIGRVKAPGYFVDPALRRAYLSAEWIGDAAGQIDPNKEIDAAIKRIDAGVSSIEIEAMELGGRKWEDILRQRVREHKARVEAGLEPPILNATATEPVMGPEDGSDEEDDTQPAGGGKQQ